MRILITATLLSLTPIVSYADELPKAVASFEQNFIRQLLGNNILPLGIPNRSGLRLCAVGAPEHQRILIENFVALFDELSMGNSDVSFTESEHDCPQNTESTLVYAGEDYATRFASLIQQKEYMLGFEAQPEALIRWSLWEGAKTAFMIDANSTLHSVSAVWLNVPDDVQSALTVKAMFQIGTVSQPVEWVGPFFSIAQTVEPTIPQALTPTLGETELSLDDYLERNAAGLCMPDLINLNLILRHLKEGLTPNEALIELHRNQALLEKEVRTSGILERFRTLVDHRCI